MAGAARRRRGELSDGKGGMRKTVGEVSEIKKTCITIICVTVN